MLRLIPGGLHRQALRIAHRLRSVWWRWRRPALRGVSILAFNEAGELLLVRHSYGADLWSFPGGGFRKGEAPLAAAQREFQEELRCPAYGWQKLGTVEERLHRAPAMGHVYRAMLAGEPRPDGREIVEARCFALDRLPANLSRRVRPRLALLSGNEPVD
ncbi:NUDIX domain-containing protein [Altericroceibacterium spongiae]|uniref:NUDIX domain-containing protein n=1 Tax=Altericroceibacterium spongiae TaxID=2320269 RepID=A0A420EM46_9SPHN|nr:NUDIX domain-containing protein [Altericroceibacterium spongiae]RKF21792.1 NUDIX domain-containing protein [Altericroceibacterium spongiae]